MNFRRSELLYIKLTNNYQTLNRKLEGTEFKFVQSSELLKESLINIKDDLNKINKERNKNRERDNEDYYFTERKRYREKQKDNRYSRENKENKENKENDICSRLRLTEKYTHKSK